MNDLFARWGLSALKPWLEVVLLSPLPLIMLALAGLAIGRRHGRAGAAIVAGSLLMLWAVCTTAVGIVAIEGLTRPPPPLDESAIARLKNAPRTAIVVLGAGRYPLAPEYGGPTLKPLTLERLRFGLWLARRTGLPVAYSGGLSWAALPGPTEAEIAQVVAARDFGWPLRWAEDRSHDTTENAWNSVALLHAAGIEQIVLVTHGFHQQRARAAFERALSRQGVVMSLVSAGVGLRPDSGLEIGDFLPGAAGLSLTMLALHEWLGWLAGA